MKNIVICCDGTGNEYGPNNTNVVKLYQSVIRGTEQIAFYDPGVGTFSYLGRELGRHVGIWLGKAFGRGLQQNIEDAYRYLMDRYQPEDKCFFSDLVVARSPFGHSLVCCSNAACYKKAAITLFPTRLKFTTRPTIKILLLVSKKRTVTSVSLTSLVYGTPLGLWAGYGGKNSSILLYTKM